MKSLIKFVLRAVWRSTQPLRRPILLKTQNFLRKTLPPPPSPPPPPPQPERFPVEEWNALMDEMVRELIRLQRRTEDLQRSVDALSAVVSPRAFAGEVWPREYPQAG
ncbi:MAG: hypothetical protein U0835_03255 [Isosphaeraceae bacterium]